MKKIHALFATLFAATSLFAADILEIRPVDPNDPSSGTSYLYEGENRPYATILSPLGSGKDIYFNIRLVSREENSSKEAEKDRSYFSLTHNPYAGTSEEYDAKMNPFQIGIVVGGKTKYASLVKLQKTPSSSAGINTLNMTDLIFVYHTEPGDFALPIKLAADRDGTPIDEYYSDLTSIKYVFNNSNKWNIYYHAKDGTTVDDADFTFRTKTSGITLDDKPETKDTLSANYSLKDCGFYVQTVDFKSPWASTTAWKTVPETQSVDGQLEASAAVTNSITLYVWSDDESVVKLVGDNVSPVTIVTDASGTKAVVQMAEVTISMWNKLSETFSIKGLKKDGTANLILSNYRGYNWNSKGTGSKIIDYKTVPVTVTDPPAPSITLAFDGEGAEARVITVPIDQTKNVGHYNLTLYPAYTNASEKVKVTVSPVAATGSGIADIFKYVHISNQNDKDYAAAWRNDGAVTLEFSGSTTVLPVYVYALGGCAGTETVEFKVTKVEPEAAAKYYGTPVDDDALKLDPQPPTITDPTDGKAYTAQGHVAHDFDIGIDDNYFNREDTNTGYRIYWYPDYAGSPKKYDTALYAKRWGLDDGILYLMNEDGTLDKETVPSVTYENTTQEDIVYKSAIRVVGPNGEYGPGPKQTSVREFTVTVSPQEKSPTVTAKIYDGTEDFVEFEDGEATSTKVTFTLSKSYSDNLYAFLAPVDPDTTNCIKSAFFTNSVSAKGILISKGYTTNSKAAWLNFLDGTENDGTVFDFDVILCKTQSYDPAQVVDTYECPTQLSFTLSNVKPELADVMMSGWPMETRTDEETGTESLWIGGSATKGVDQVFTFEVNDAAADLEATGDDRFSITYQFSGAGVKDGTKKTIRGNPADLAVTNKFMSIGTGTLAVTLKDKDGGKSQTYTIKFKVTDNPCISITPTDGSLSIDVNENATTEFKVQLSENKADENLDVYLTVTPNSTGDKAGAMILEGDCTPVPESNNVYKIVYKSGETEHYVRIKPECSDGTGLDSNALSKFALTAEVVTKTKVPEVDIAWSKYYTPGRFSPVTVINVVPSITVDGKTCTEDADLNSSNSPIQVAIGEAPEIVWSVNDVYADLTNAATKGIKVTIFDHAGTHTTNATDTSDHTFTPTFKNPGSTTVRITATDKDGGSTTVTYYYLVKSTRMLNMTAVGGGSAKSTLAGNYADRGEGHVWVGGKQNPSGSLFSFDWNCQLMNSVTAIARGYRVGDVDNGTLLKNLLPSGEKDLAVSPTGGLATGAPYYTYNPADKKDSFFYCWINATDSEDGTREGAIYGAMQPEIYTNQARQTSISLPNEANEDGSYNTTYFEAVFAREYLPSDNIGDINQDGVPDVYVKGYKFDVFDSKGALAGDDTLTLNDIGLNDQTNVDGDYFPFLFGSLQAAFMPSTTNKWVGDAHAFTTRMEIRGLGEPLNDAYRVLNKQGYAAGIMEYKADICYEDPSVNSNSTLTALEWDAYVQAGKPGYGTAHPEESWSPERPTSPITADTDRDGLPDGYEYYIWYKAKVGYIEYKDDTSDPTKGVHKYLTGRQYNPTNPFEPTIITPDELCKKFDPLTNGSYDWDTLDTDWDGITDYQEFAIGTNPFDYDSDGDGLPDGYEVSITLTDPLKGDTDGDGTADGAENDDKDSMAVYLETMNLIGIKSGEKTLYYCTQVTNDFSVETAETGTDCWRLEVHVKKTDTEMTTNVYFTTKAGFDDTEKNIYTAGTGKKCLIGDLEKKDTWTGRTIEGTNALLRGTAVRLARGTQFDVVEKCTYFKQKLSGVPEQVYVAYPYTSGFARGRKQTYLSTNSSEIVDWQQDVEVQVMHYYVYQEHGFDPRTGWCHEGAFAPVNETAAYTHMDEHLAMLFFYQAGAISAADMEPTIDKPMLARWSANTTHPRNADTDGDAMPDGWEFYLMSGPDGYAQYLAPGSKYSPIYPISGPLNATPYDRDNDVDGLQWPMEYSGVKSSARYGMTQTHPLWRNKAYPTDPWNDDTDGDGMYDGPEGGELGETLEGGLPAFEAGVVATSFRYNDSGIAGGMLNPLSVDTDLDGLPDPWETEFYGTYTAANPQTTVTTKTIEITTTDGTVTSATTNETSVVANTGAKWNMDGMDGTVPDERLDYDSDGLANWQEYMVGAMRCWRYDDPVSSWGVNEMTTNAIAKAQAKGKAAWGKFWYDRLVNPASPDYNPTLANGYLNGIGAYFTCCQHEWDLAYCGWYMYRDGIDHDLKKDFLTSEDGLNRFTRKASETWGDGAPYNISRFAYPLKYISCDPRRHDTDFDGMDDYYELFHGMNPILGDAGVQDLHAHAGYDTAYDVVYDAYLHYPGVYTVFLTDAYGSADLPPTALNNWWRNNTENHATVRMPEYKKGSWSDNNRGYDFIANPWLNGIAGADPDGDNIVNQEESIMPNVQAASTYHHSDPTPLWMTDSSYTNSLVRKYYRIDPLSSDENFTECDFEFSDEFVHEGVTYKFSDYPGFYLDANGGLHFYTKGIASAYPKSVTRSEDTTASYYSANDLWWYLSNGWMFSFEENEGYDSDHDFLSDYEEAQGKTKNASNVQEHDDPLRRQPMYFNGKDAFLQTPVESSEAVPRDQLYGEARQNFLYFTVECWAKPDAESLANDGNLRALVARSIWADNSGPADEKLMRRNFLIGVKDGRWYASFDGSSTDTNQTVQVSGGPLASTEWTHVAATFDGTVLKLYVNGTCQGSQQKTSIQPEHGMNALALNAAGEINRKGTSFFDSSCITITVGAVPVTRKGIIYDYAWRYRSYGRVDAKNPFGLASQTKFSDYGSWYKGYIDEVRIWDGARASADIGNDYKNRTRYTTALAAENRQTVYSQWKNGARRAASSTALSPQLMYHWAFDHIAGAVLTNDLIKVPAGFGTDYSVTDAKARWSRPADWVENCWANSAVKSTVYTDNSWVPWINNTVSHLPRFDLTTLDSVYWSEDYAGATNAAAYGYSSFDFPRSNEVYSRWTQQQYADDEYYDSHYDPDFTAYNAAYAAGKYVQNTRAYTQDTRYHAINGYAASGQTNITVFTEELNKLRFAARDRNVVGDDILPMGGAYPRRISLAEGGMWDAKDGEEWKCADAWAQTGPDADNNCLPDWWEDYARQNYGEGLLDPHQQLEWGTLVNYYGATMAAYQAYLRDLAKGMVKIGDWSGYDENYVDKRDTDKDGMPDWWEELYGLDATTDNADDDPDQDGLSNYQEYLLGEIYPDAYDLAGYGIDVGKINLSPVLAYSTAGQKVTDYYLCYTNVNVTKKVDGTDGGSITNHFYLNEYFGEIMTDHDFMEDWWENQYDIDYTSMRVYDPAADADGDGWSTWAECRSALWGASFSADLIGKWTSSQSDQYVICRPQPIVGVKVTAFKDGTVQDLSGKQLVVRTTSGQTQRTDATFVVPPTLDGQTKYIGPFSGDTVMHGHLSPGLVNVNSIVFDCANVGNDKVYTWNCDWYKENEPDDLGWTHGYIDDDGVRYYSWRTWSDSVRTHTGTFEEYKAEFEEWPYIELEGGDFTWESIVETKPSADLASATLLLDGVTVFGTVDCTTGEYELDMTKFSKGNVDEYVFRVTYTSRLGHEWPQTVYLSDTKELKYGTDTDNDLRGEGYIREGKNTIEAFMDLDADGVYDPGEPYGVVQDVDVGWHKTPVVTIELKDTSHVVPRFDVSASTDDRTVVLGAEASHSTIVTSEGGNDSSAKDDSSALSRTFAIRRKTINGASEVTSADGITKSVPQRTLATKTLVLDSRSYLTEADVLGSGSRFDLDSKWLVRDCEKLGIDPAKVTNAGYAIEEEVTAADGTVSNAVVMTFVNTFGNQRVKATAVSPLDHAPVYANSPTFAFSSSDETMTAYRLRIRRAGDKTVVYDSGDTPLVLPGRVLSTAGTAVYEVTPPVYAGARVTSGSVTGVRFEDGAEYEWRVALYNAKYATDDLTDKTQKEEDIWSDWTAFRMDIAKEIRNPKIATGYGCLSLAVRYYGPTNLLALAAAKRPAIYVEAFESGDFRGQPLARAEATLDGSLADRLDATTTNVVLRGIAPGTRFVRAYIDFNGNGERDDWESWGYVNNVGKGVKAIYNPIDIEVTSSTADWTQTRNAQYTLFIEDCDTDKNEIPDCLEPPPTEKDSDGDGLSDDDETTLYGTDPGKWDTDDDGMPDGWEVLFGDTDAKVADADECASGDLMAFARIDATFVTISNAVSSATRYMLAADATVPAVGDNVTGLAVWSTYDYTVYENGTTASETGIGTPLAVSGRVTLVETGKKAILVHDQVYRQFGFAATAAVSLGDEYTKEFTALDKYLIIRYRDAIGQIAYPGDYKSGEDYVNRMNLWSQYSLKPFDTDNDGDGIADGWELYVGANPWSDADRDTDTDKDGATLVQEYNGGTPTDPANPHTVTVAPDLTDGDVYKYHLHTAESQLADEDNDGLSNWAEYLAYKKTGKDFDVTRCCSVTANRYDYFVKTADGKYVGESLDADGLSLIADHDFMEDAWENLWDPAGIYPYSLYANRYVYDANLDGDEDGWKNWSECRAYHWGCGFYSDIIDTFITGDIDSQLRCFPQPAIGLHVTYNGSKDPSWKSLIVRTRTADSTYPDAIFQIDSMKKASGGGTVTVGTNATSTVGGMEKTQILGVYNGMKVIRGYLNPGLIVPSSAKFEMTSVSQELTYYWHCTECQRGSGTYMEYKADITEHGEAKTDPNNKGVTLDETKPSEGWTTFATSGGGSDGRHGEIYVLSDEDLSNTGSTAVGTIDYRTGEFSLDLATLSEEYGLGFDGKAFRAVFTYNLGAYWPQTVWLSAPEKGYVKEGLNTIEAFLDLDEDGRYDIGEPYGELRNVNIGWNRTPEMRIELKDGTYNGVPLFEIESGTAEDNDDEYDKEQSTIDSQQITDGKVHPAKIGVDKAKVTVTATNNVVEEIGVDGGTLVKFLIEPDGDNKGRLRIVRTAVNGMALGSDRTVWAKRIDVTYGKVYTVADFIGKGQVDFDSAYLVSDAAAAGIPADRIRTVEYAVCWGSDSAEPLFTFTRTFDMSAVAPALSSAYENAYYKNLTAQPELSWVGSEGYGAFAVQVSERADFATVLYAATNLLPAASTTDCTFKPDLYVGEGLKDRTTYYWRVAQLNAKFTANVWSQVASFSTAVNSKNADTGYGPLAAEVRYYGPSGAALSQVVVGVYESGDFCCAPVARKRLAGSTPVSSLANASGAALGAADTNVVADIFVADTDFKTISTNVVFDGIAPGEYYVMAFVDKNGNGVRDAFETWGYANKITTEEADIYTPVAATVVSTKASVPQVLVVMEDTDVNQDMIPDCLEDMTDWELDDRDSDGDGLSDNEEKESGTDAMDSDSDGDRMPDGWEEKYAETHVNTVDADVCAEGDVMAFATIDATYIVVDGEKYMLSVGEKVPAVGDSAEGLSVWTTYAYPVQVDGEFVDQTGIGLEFTLSGGTVESVEEDQTAVLVHAQVYDWFGFDATTATAADDAANTKEFTALDKYLVIRYLDNIGMIPYDPSEYDSGEDFVNYTGTWDGYSLRPNCTDNDGDGIADGWELYVMFGPTGAGSAGDVSDAAISPWNKYDARAFSPGDAELPEDAQMTLLGEFQGDKATDPWQIDTDGDNVIDRYYHDYMLWDPVADPDGDGLSNYAEYLISKVFKFAELDPNSKKTNGSVVDYFRKEGELYYGEMFADHDQVDDTWEQQYGKFASRYEYDPDKDPDGDGWSNYAEAKVGTNPGAVAGPGVGYSLPEYPIPAIAAKVVYSGKQTLSGALHFQCWSQATDPEMTGVPDATWTSDAESQTNSIRYLGVNPGKECRYYLGTGTVSPGTVCLRFRDMAYGTAAVSDGTAESTNTVEAGYANWYPIVLDNGYGVLYTSASHTARTKVGTVDYATGEMVIDFGCDALQGYAFDSYPNGTSGSATTKKHSSTYANADVLDLSRSYVLIEWTPVKVATTGNATYYLSAATGGKGHVREGKQKFVVWCDMADSENDSVSHTDGKWDPGEPFGFVRDVDVGWQGGSFEVELTETSPVFARIDLMLGSGGTSSGIGASGSAVVCSDRQVWQEGSSTVTDIGDGSTASQTLCTKMGVTTKKGDDALDLSTTRLTRIRVTRVLVNGDNKLGYEGTEEVSVKGVVLDKYMDLGTRSYLHEGDFLTDGAFDADWGNLETDICNGNYLNVVGSRNGYVFQDPTNVTYAIVIGEGDIGASNLVFRCVVNKTFDGYLFSRKSEGAQLAIRPEIDPTQPQDMVYGSRPTFRFAMRDAKGNNYNSYTAFKLQITAADGTEVYTSDYRDLPPCDGSGWYSWTLDEPIGTKIPASGTYSWRVALYNAKFKSGTYRDKVISEWSDAGTFVVNMNNQQAMNDHGYSSVAAAVKYAGPSAVLANVAGVSANGKCIVQAFETADFASAPAGQSYVSDDIGETASVVANAVIKGLPQTGTYYLRAFIDSNGNGAKDDFESWGAASEAVTLSADVVTVPTVGVWIEDADTDGDWLPDAWEYATAGWSGEWSDVMSKLTGKLNDNGDDHIASATFDTAGLAGISTGLGGASLTVFQNPYAQELLPGFDFTKTISIDAIRAAVEEQKIVKGSTFKITALTLNPEGTQVTLSLDAEVTDSIAGELLGRLYNITSGNSATVTVRVYKKTTLAEAWPEEAVCTKTVTFGVSQPQVEVPVSGIDMTSGFYKVEVVQ